MVRFDDGLFFSFCHLCFFSALLLCCPHPAFPRHVSTTVQVKLFGFSSSLVACVAQGKQETKKMVAVSRRGKQSQKLLRSIQYRLHCGIGIGAKALPISSNQSGQMHTVAKLSTAALCPSPLVLLVRCAILRVCPRVLPGSMGAVLFYQWVESARLDVALQRELGRKQKRHTDISHVRGRSPVPTLRRKVDNSFSSRPRSSHPSWLSFSL